MELEMKNRVSLPYLCEYCGSAGTNKCARCYAAYYCSKDHQRQHWPIHKRVCKKSVPPVIAVSANVNQPSTSSMTFVTSEKQIQSNVPHNINEEINQVAMPNNRNITAENKNLNLIHGGSVSSICRKIIHGLNTRGFCVVDDFMGSSNGNLILEEVKNLYGKGIFQKGELVSPGSNDSNENIRSDVTTWIKGTEPHCTHIRSLMKKMDEVMSACNTMPNNEILSNYKLYNRTKAMVACYPGNGTYYKRHIDNPQKDGRCITCVYYLNKKWDMKQHGGLLRVFPSLCHFQIVDIGPVFDRLVLFWSDKRTPHEVLPTFALRFAITLWYFDEKERNKALIRSSLKS